MTALAALVEHEALGQRARFERYAADLLYAIAAGGRIDTDRVERFGTQVERVYADPFAPAKKQPPKTAAEIKQYLLDKINELKAAEEEHGSDDLSRENYAG